MKTIILLFMVTLISCGKEYQTNTITEYQYEYLKEVSLTCKSTNYQDTYCPMSLPFGSEIKEIKLISQSPGTCKMGTDYDFNLDNETVLVKNNCQETFKIYYTTK